MPRVGEGHDIALLVTIREAHLNVTAIPAYYNKDQQGLC